VKFFVVAVTLGFLVAPAMAEPREISEQLEKIQEKHQIPALTAAAVVEGKLVAIGASGFRNTDDPTPVTTSDKWHIGSCTKSMTASVVAMLVEEGTMAWDTQINDYLWDIPMNDEWRNVTVEQLLVHRGGAPHDPPRLLWKEACAQEGTPTEQRLAFVRGILAEEPEKPPGTKWIYSDTGYSIVGVIMERATGRTWEDLLRERLFEPLGMTSAGFGSPGTSSKVDQPWGHLGDEAPFKPVAPGPRADNPPAIGPAGTVHCSIADFARYTAWHVAGERGEGTLLSFDSIHKLHEPADGQTYGMGWCNLQRRWAGGTALMHTGENTMFYAVMWLGPGADTAFVAAANCDAYDARDACDEAIRYLINEF
jgi:CubicO group peptidase (beta-lactamase class C family)